MKKYPILKAVIPLDNYKLMLIFGENEKRIYDFKPNLSHKFYSPLADIKLFNSVTINDGEIEWITGQDFCPYTLYDQSIPYETECTEHMGQPAAKNRNILCISDKT